MTRGTAMFAVGGLFLAGIAIGVLGTLLFADLVQPPWLPGAGGARGSGGPRPGRGDAPEAMHLERLAGQLQLSDDQRAEIEAILDEVRNESEAIRAELGPRLHDLMQRTDERIRDELDDAQRARFDQLRDRKRAQMERFLVGGPGPRGGGPGRRRPGPGGRRPPPPPPPGDGL